MVLPVWGSLRIQKEIDIFICVVFLLHFTDHCFESATYMGTGGVTPPPLSRKSDTFPGKLVIEKRIKLVFTLPRLGLFGENPISPTLKNRFPPSLLAHPPSGSNRAQHSPVLAGGFTAKGAGGQPANSTPASLPLVTTPFFIFSIFP